MRKPLLLLLLAACEGRIAAPAPKAVDPGQPPVDPAVPLVCDDRRHAAATTLHRLTPAQYQHALADIFDGRVAASAKYPAAYGRSVTGYSTEEALGAVSEQGAEQLMSAAEEVALAVAPVLGDLLPCSRNTAPGAACLATYLDTFGRRAYRRALSPDERAALTATHAAARAAGATFTEAVAVMTAQLLQTPQFLYLVEDAGGTGRQLSADELASRLSFMLWDSVPDDALLARAADGTLSDPAVLAAEARRLLDSPKADTALARLLREWTQAARLTSSEKDQTAFPFFTDAYAQSLNGSFDRFAAAQLRTGTLATLLTTTDAYVDARLAAAWGVTAPAAGQWAKVQLDGSRYAGVGTQPLVTASHAHASDASFVFRGRFVRQRLLCNVLGTPPADAQAQFSAIALPPDPTGKEVSAAVVARSPCGSCHTQLDPAGLALEHFDGAGRWRDTYASGRAIDVTGTLPRVDGASADFASPVDLFAKLAASDDAEACVAKQLFRYTFSRAETPDDACAIEAVRSTLRASNGDLTRALLALISTDAFSWRADL